jgi:hypothetical protein
MQGAFLRAVSLLTLLFFAQTGKVHAKPTWSDLQKCLGVLIPITQEFPRVEKVEFKTNELRYRIPPAFTLKLKEVVRSLGLAGDAKEKWLRKLEATFFSSDEMSKKYPLAPAPTDAWTEELMHDRVLARALREVLESRTASQSARLLESFRNAAEIEELAIVTHQNEERQASTAAHLNGAPFSGVPVVTLVNPTHRLPSRALFDRSDLIVFSPAGELDPYWVNAQTVHLFGGSCALCLSGTLESVIKGFVRNSTKSRMTVYFHGNHIYNNTKTLAQLVTEAGPAFSLADHLQLFDIQDLRLKIAPGEIGMTRFGPGMKFLLTSEIMKIYVTLVIVGVKNGPVK